MFDIFFFHHLTEKIFLFIILLYSFLIKEDVALLRNLKELIVSIATISGVIVAYLGLATWKKQIVGREDYELSRRLLRATFGVRDAIYSVRQPFISVKEMTDALKTKGLSEEEIVEKIHNIESTRAVYEIRWREIQSARSNWEVEVIEAEVLWGDNFKPILTDLENCLSKLNISLWQHLNPDMRDPSQNKLKFREIIYGKRENYTDNEFTNEVEKAVKKIEEYVRPHLKL